MRIEIDLPDWCDERNIYILAGIELAAYKKASEGFLHVKKERCNFCGTCCCKPSAKFPFGRKENGECEHLHRSARGDYTECKLNVYRPTRCSCGMQQKGVVDGCNIEYEERPLIG